MPSRLPHLPLRSLLSGALALGAAVSLLHGCKPKPPVITLTHADGTVVEAPPPAKSEDEQQARTLASDANTLEADGDSTKASAKRTNVLTLFPNTIAAAEIFHARAEAAAKQGRHNEAIGWFEKLLFYRPDYVQADSARRSYSESLLGSARWEDAAKMLHPLYERSTDGNDRVELGTMLAKAWSRAGRAREALNVHVSLRNTKEASAEVRALATESAIDLVSRDLSFAEAESLWKDVENSADWKFLHAVLAYKLAKIYYHTRNYAHSEAMLELVATRFTQSTFGEPAREFLERIRNRFKVAPNTIGVLLPLSGKYKQYGERSLAAIKQGFGVGSPIRLVVKDTEGDPTVVAKAVEDLVLDDHVLAIIGPLFSKTSMAACIKAEELSVPIISLSHRQGLPELGPWVYRSALTIKAQAQALAKIAFESLGITRFAMLYPQSRYGSDFTQAFWDEVDRRKGEIRAIETYERDQTTFFNPVRKLVGRYYLNSRPAFIRGIREIRARRLPPQSDRRARQDLESSMIPVIDFEAIVIPDSGRNIGLIAPALAVEDIVLTHDEKELKTIRKATGRDDIEPIRLLGGSTWNSRFTVDSCERYCEDAIFVDGYFPDHPNPRVRDFVSTFRETMDANPLLGEAQAFDTAGLLKWLLVAAPPNTREDLRKQLDAVTGYDGVTGKLRFNDHGEMERELYTLTIKDRQISIWQKSETAPEG